MKKTGGSSLSIRRAESGDIEAITDIYNDAILKTVATFDTAPKTMREQKAWFAQHGGKYPAIVAELDGDVAGWASLSRWSDRCAYSGTAELSLYVREDMRGKGVGGRLMRAIVKEGERAGLHTAIARITEGNAVSVRMHEAAGFEPVGIMKKVGRKFGRLLDVQMMQLVYPSKGKR